jgi:hypothetical protein
MNLTDVLYISLKVRERSPDEEELTETELSYLDRWQPFDSALYEAANTALDDRINAFGAKQKSCTYNTSMIPSERDKVNCKHYLRDNKDLVNFAWKYDLNPPKYLL